MLEVKVEPVGPFSEPLLVADSILCDDLLNPGRLWSRQEILSRASPVPKVPGVYAWYFRNMPPHVPSTGCATAGDFNLLYVGISPSAPPANGKAASKQTLWHRIRYHMRGNAEGSTLRLSLGCLLAEQLGIGLRRVGSGKRFTFSTGEKLLSEWCQGRIDGKPLGRRKREPVKGRGCWYFGGERTLERSGRG
jgi:hypothetical protein